MDLAEPPSVGIRLPNEDGLRGLVDGGPAGGQRGVIRRGCRRDLISGCPDALRDVGVHSGVPKCSLDRIRRRIGGAEVDVRQRSHGGHRNRDLLDAGGSGRLPDYIFV